MSATKDMRLLLFVNRRSGRGAGLKALAEVLSVFRSEGVEVVVAETDRPEEMRQRMESVAPGEVSAVGALGGDGTMHHLLGGMMQREPEQRIPLALLPGGTGNSLMTDLGVHDPAEAARRISRGTPRPLDALAVRSGGEITWCFNIAGWGMVVDINALAERLRFLGGLRYNTATAMCLLKLRRYRARIQLDDETLSGDFLFAVVCNTVHTGRAMRIAPRAVLDDGLVDVVLVREAPRLKLLALFRAVLRGTHLDHPAVEYRQVRRFAVRESTASPLNLDGELRGGAPFEVEVHRGAFDLLWSGPLAPS